MSRHRDQTGMPRVSEKEEWMESKYLLWGGLAMAGLVCAVSLSAILPKARMTLRRMGTVTFTSGGGGATPKADPARGYPA